MMLFAPAEVATCPTPHRESFTATGWDDLPFNQHEHDHEPGIFFGPGGLQQVDNNRPRVLVVVLAMYGC